MKHFSSPRLNQNNDTIFIDIKQKIKKLWKIEYSEICHVILVYDFVQDDDVLSKIMT